MILAKNYETIFKFIKVKHKMLWTVDTVYTCCLQ